LSTEPDVNGPGATARSGRARLIFVDVFGGSHAVLLPAGRLQGAIDSGVPFDGSALQGRSRHFEIDMLLKPDPSTFVDVGGEIRAVCSITTRDGQPWLADPRAALAEIISRTGELAERFEVAAELEFYLLDHAGVPVDNGGYFGDLAGVGTAVTNAAADMLGSFGVKVVSAHLEAGPGQYEIDLGAMPPVALADALVLAKALLRQVAEERGVVATFMARPLAGQPGSGLHLHQHVLDQLFDDHWQLDEAGRAFVGGQLLHARALTALAAPNVNSYKRLHAGPEAPGAVVWGHQSRNAVIRVGSSVEQRPSVEFRLADPAANPYLLLGGLLVAAADGLARELDPGPAFDEDIGGYDPTTVTKIQAQLLPRVLDQALDALLDDDVLVDAFDAQLLTRMVDGRRAEAQAYRAQVTAWELDRYLNDA
jgi:glutamine synthetase